MTSSGLGLWVVYGIVKEHKALIDVYSEHGKGTIFNIYFPALEQEEEIEMPKYIKGSQGKEKILAFCCKENKRKS